MRAPFRIGGFALAWLVSGVFSENLEATEVVGYALENGDTNGDLTRDLSDGIYALSNLFLGGPSPVPLATCSGRTPAVRNGDTNGDGSLDVSDIVGLFNWLFSSGPAPVSSCGDGLAGNAGTNPRVVPTHASPYGTSYEQLAADFWTWMWTAPLAEHPGLDETGEFCDVGQSGNIWFLGGVPPAGGGTFERSCTVPAGTALFFPPINISLHCPLPFESVEDLRRFAAEFPDHIVELEVTVDGTPLENLFDYRVQSEVYHLPPSELLDSMGVPPFCTGTPAIADGFYLLLAPLAAGHHVVQYKVVGEPFVHSLFGPVDGISVDVTYHLEVAGGVGD